MDGIEEIGRVGEDENSISKKRVSSSGPENVDTAVCSIKKTDLNEATEEPSNLEGIEDDTVPLNKKFRTTQSSPNVADEAGLESPINPEKLEKLEVPSKELQCIQKQVLIEKLMETSTSNSEGVEEPMDVQIEPNEGRPKPDLKRGRSKNQSRGAQSRKPENFRKTFKMQSSVLNRVKSFLPELKTANDELLRLPDPSKLSLESDMDETDNTVAGPSRDTNPLTKEGGKTYVEMNLALIEQSDSDSSSEDEIEKNQPILNMNLKGLPVSGLNKTVSNITSNNTESSSNSNKTAALDQTEIHKTSSEKSALITELN